MTSRDLVKATLNFENKTERVPRQMWTLPWAEIHAGDMLKKIHMEFPDDIVSAPAILAKPTIAQGDPHALGEYTDEWGCKFINIHEGIIGEVKEALVKDEEWGDWENIHIPVELLDFDSGQVNEFCKSTDKFVMAGCNPRPFEQLQFIRTTQEFYMDLVDPPANMLKFMDKMFAFYCELVEKWAKTDVDAISFMDDWGEIDRQHLLPEGSTEDIRRAVTAVKERLWDNGGCIAQCEFGPGAKKENVYTVFETWNKL